MTTQNSVNNKSCGCIIPFYNEGKRVLNVLATITRVKNITTIVCVDDGSTDTTYQDIQKIYPTVKVIRLKKNSGKSAAVEQGFKHINENYVLLFDADLYNFQKEEIEKPIAAILHDQRVDMIILKRKNDPWNSKIIRGDVTVTGERVLKTDDLREIFKRKPNSYQLEFAINFYSMEKKKHAYWIEYLGRNVPKIKKVGLIKGSFKEIKMYLHIIAFGGLIKTIFCIMTFCRKQYNPSTNN